MSWLDSLDVPIAEALALFPAPVSVASLKIGSQQWLVSRQALEDMARMQLGHLPLSTVVLPYELSHLLTRQTEEVLIRDVTAHLSDYFPNFFVAAIYELQSLFNAQGMDAYIIGGIVRDMLLSGERRFSIEDVDIIVEGQAVTAGRFVSERSNNFKLLNEYAPFGTAKLKYKNQIDFDFASTRQEIYPECGHLPEIVSLGVPLQQDITRRDFTINALALSISRMGHVIDCTGGLQDLEARKIRLLKVPSFFEDPSRILRAVGFAARLDFDWSADTRFLLEPFKQWMGALYRGGGERIRDELYRFLRLPENPAKHRWLQFWVEQGLHRLMDTHLPATLDLPLPLPVLTQRVTYLQDRLGPLWNETLAWETYLTLMLLGLPPSFRNGAAHRMELTRHELDVLEKGGQLLNENTLVPLTPHSSPCTLYDTFHALPTASVLVGLVLSPEYTTNTDAFLHYKAELASVQLDVNGADILNLGVPQGKAVGELLKALFHAKLLGQVGHRLDELNWLQAQLSPATEETPT